MTEIQKFDVVSRNGRVYPKDVVDKAWSEYMSKNKENSTECDKCTYYDKEDDVCGAFVCNGLECPPLPCEEGYDEYRRSIQNSIERSL